MTRNLVEDARLWPRMRRKPKALEVAAGGTRAFADGMPGLTQKGTKTRLCEVVANEFSRFRRAFREPGLLKDRRNVGVGGEALPPLRIPVENRPHPVAVVRIPEDVRTLAAVLL